MPKIIFIYVLLLIPSITFSQTKNSLFYRGNKSQKGIAIIISNRTPIAKETVNMLNDLTRRGFKVALSPSDIDMSELSNHSPFTEDTFYVLKLSVLNESATENLLSIDTEFIRISDEKKITQHITFPRSNIKNLTSQLEKIFRKFIPILQNDDPKILSVSGNEFTFSKKNFAPVKKGDEIIIQYQNARDTLTESFGIISKISQDRITAKDINKKVQVNDTIINISPKRNRFSFSLGINIPMVGDNILKATKDDNLWESASHWPVGMKISAEYERFLPYQLVSTTAMGLNITGMMGTYIHTGIGYRAFYKTWEFIPYVRLGVMYSPLALTTKHGSAGQLQGAIVQWGLSSGISMIKRMTRDFFIGMDIGFQWYPFEYAPLSSDSKKIAPNWIHRGNLSKDIPITEFYPYISIKASWFF